MPSLKTHKNVYFCADRRVYSLALGDFLSTCVFIWCVKMEVVIIVGANGVRKCPTMKSGRRAVLHYGAWSEIRYKYGRVLSYGPQKAVDYRL